MKEIKFICAFFIIAISANAHNPERSYVVDPIIPFVTNYISLPVPQDYHGEISYLDPTALTKSNKAVDGVKHDNTLLPSFSDLVSSVTVYQLDEDGSLTLLTNKLSAKKSTYEVIYDYTQTQTIQIDQSGQKISALIGISVRMVARITTKESGLNLADIFKVGLAANRKKVSGTLQVRVSGINSQTINSLIPVTTDLSPASIATCLQAVTTVKSHIYDADTRITPQFLAYGSVGDTKTPIKVDLKDLSEKLKTFTF